MTMTFGIQIKTFKFIDKDCDEIDTEVNSFLKSITENSGTIKDVIPLINANGNIEVITVKYICSMLEIKKDKERGILI